MWVYFQLAARQHQLTDIFTRSQPANPSVTRSLPTLSRLAISDGAAFMELLRHSANQLGVPADELAKVVLQKWLDRVSILIFIVWIVPDLTDTARATIKV